jgi:hypothetical protein
MKGFAQLSVKGIFAFVLLVDVGLASDTPLSIGGVSLGQSEASVVANLGNPQNRERRVGFLPITLSYSDFWIYLDDQGVGGMRSTNPTICTAGNVCPGMTHAQVQSVYGASETYKQDSTSYSDYPTSYSDYLGQDGCWLRIAFELDVVSSVEVMCSP